MKVFFSFPSYLRVWHSSKNTLKAVIYYIQKKRKKNLLKIGDL